MMINITSIIHYFGYHEHDSDRAVDFPAHVVITK